MLKNCLGAIISLSSKTYSMYDERSVKVTHKGVSRSKENIFQKYLHVLQNMTGASGVSRGMRRMPNTGLMHGFSLTKRNVFPFLYAKRYVVEDRIGTFPLEFCQYLLNDNNEETPEFIKAIKVRICERRQAELQNILTFHVQPN